MMQLTTRTNHRLALEPAHIAGVEEMPELQTGEPVQTRTRIHMASGVTHEVAEPFGPTYEEWATQQDFDDAGNDPDTVAAIKFRVGSLQLPQSVADVPDMREAFAAFKEAVIAAIEADVD